jgi:GR25 family glycosyltransferase involved in LPS biosynthesis
MTMPTRLNHVKTQLIMPNSIIVNSFCDINIIIPSSYVKDFKIKSKELCALTYIKTLELFINSSDEICIIFEDDIAIKNELLNDINKIEKTCKEYNLDLIYLYHLNLNYKNISDINNIKYIDNLSDGNQAIMWSKKGAKKFLNNLPIILAKDEWLKNLIQKGIFNSLTTYNNYVENLGCMGMCDFQSKMGSTIYNIKPTNNKYKLITLKNSILK